VYVAASATQPDAAALRPGCGDAAVQVAEPITRGATLASTTRFRAVALEMVVIVASILIAFALDAWWDRAQESAAEQAILNDLIEQFEATRVNLADQRRVHLAGVAAVDRMLDRFGKAPPDGTVAFPDSTIMRLYTIPTFDRREYRLESLIQSGRLEVIENPELRDGLARWPGVVAEMLEHQLAARSIYQELVVPHLLVAGDVSGLMVQSRRSSMNEPVLGTLRYGAGSETDLMNGKELRGALAYLSTQNGRAAWELELMDAILEEMLHDLKEELRP
jgi:hypothetical protein